MTLFGVLWICILIYCFSRRGYYYSILVLLTGMLFQCNNVLLFGTVGIGPQIITSISFIIIYFIKQRLRIARVKVSKYTLWGATLIVLPLLLTTNEKNILRVIMLLSYMIVAFLLSNCTNKISKIKLNRILVNITIFVLVIGFIGMLQTSGLIPRLWIFKEFIYNDVMNSQFYLINYQSRFFSTFQEASYCAPFLVAMFFYFLDSKEIQNRKYLMAFIIIAILLSFSSTAYLSFMFALLLWSIGSENKKAKKIIIPISLIGMIFMLTFGYSVLNNVIFNKLQSGSGGTRTNWDRNAIDAFINGNKIIGSGFKTQRGSSIITTLLSETGIVGLLGYLVFNFSLILKKGQKLIRTDSLMVITAMTCSVIACPDLDLCSYWFVIYVVIILAKIGKNDVEIHKI